MRGLIALGLLSALASCADPVQDAQDELDIVKNTTDTYAEECAARRKLADAYLKSKDENGYREAKLGADITCNLSSSNRALGLSDKRRPAH